MNIAFRVDANVDIGAGHLMRCITLASAFFDDGIKPFFITQHSTMASKLLSTTPYNVVFINNDSDRTPDFCNDVLEKNNIDTLIIDHLTINYKWQSQLSTKNIVVIDDKPSRKHLCNILIDTSSKDKEVQYRKLTPKGCVYLIGSEFALIRSEFSNHVRSQNQFDLLICFGGSDPDNHISKCLKILNEASFKGSICVILGNGYPFTKDLNNQLNQCKLNVHLHRNPKKLSDLMSSSNIIITAAGTMLFEAAALGKKIIMIQTDACQSGNIKLFLNQNAAYQSSIEMLPKSIVYIQNSDSNIENNAKNLCDGNGKIRVKDQIKTIMEKGK